MRSTEEEWTEQVRCTTQYILCILTLYLLEPAQWKGSPICTRIYYLHSSLSIPVYHLYPSRGSYFFMTVSQLRLHPPLDLVLHYVPSY